MSTRVYKFLSADQPDSVLAKEKFIENDPKFIVRDDHSNQYHVFNTYPEFEQWFARGHIRTLHEVVRKDVTQKIRFDFDHKHEDGPLPFDPNILTPAMIDSINLAIFLKYGGIDAHADVVVCDSSDETKFSRHYIVNNFAVADHIEAKFIAAEIMSVTMGRGISDIVDMGVYKSTQNFRLPLCYKSGTTRVKRITSTSPDGVGHTFTDCVLTQTQTCRILPRIAPRQDLQAADHLQVDDAAVLKIAEPFTKDHKFHKKTGAFFNYRRERASYCNTCGRVHANDNTVFLTVAGNGDVLLHCRHAPKGTAKVIGNVTVAPPMQEGEDEEVKPAAKPALFDERVNRITERESKTAMPFEQVKHEERHVCDYDYGMYDTLISKSQMGTGKSYALRKFVNTLPADARIVMVSFRCSFTTSVIPLMPGFIDYRKIDGPIDVPRVVIQLESLWRLTGAAPDLLILDESESIISQLENPQLYKSGHIRAVWERFEQLLRFSKQVIAIDAFAGKRTFDLIKQTRSKVRLDVNEYKPGNSSRKIYESEDDFDEKVMSAELPIAIACTSKGKAGRLEDRLRQKYPTKNILTYNGDSTEAERATLADVNTTWSRADILIYTSTVSAGVSFERDHFKQVFAYFSSRSTDWLTAVQMLGRIRTVRDFHIYVRPSSTRVPYTHAEVEQTLLTLNGIAHSDTAARMKAAGAEPHIDHLRTYLDAAGRRVFANKDLYYHTHINNLVHRGQSVMFFLDKLVEALAQMGGDIIGVNRTCAIGTCDPRVSERVLHEKEVKGAHDYEVASARTLADAEYDDLTQHDKNITREDKLAVQKYNIAATYNIPCDKVVPTFVTEYGSAKKRRAFRNLNNFVAATEGSLIGSRSIIAGPTHMFADRTIGDTSIDEVRASEKVKYAAQAIIGYDMIAMVLAERPSAGLCKVYLAKAALQERMKRVAEYVSRHNAVITATFDIKARATKQLFAERELKDQLAYVNSILKCAFDVSVVAERSRDKRSTLYYIKPSTFVWDATSESWQVRQCWRGDVQGEIGQVNTVASGTEVDDVEIIDV